jgi:GNAT superfamily N-acetyltransferase
METPAAIPASVVIREARADDLESIVRLHEADALGGHGDAWTEANRPAYEAAFAAIAASPGVALYVAEDGGEIVGTFQLALLPGLTGRGALRAKLEAVQVRRDRRSRRLGAAIVARAVAIAQAAGAAAMELTSNKRRLDAHRFYERLGFARSHDGFKKRL